MLNRLVDVRLRVGALASLVLLLFPPLVWAQANGQLQIHVTTSGRAMPR